MIKVYLKQAWELLKQNKLFSMLYIVGTGLAIAMTMIMAVVYYVKIAPVYPEANRMNTLYLSNSKFTQGSGNNTRTMQFHSFYRIFTIRSFSTQHQCIGTIVDGICNVSNLCTSRTRIVNHGV